MASTRRLAAILAADVAGYSRLMGADEEGTYERLKAHLHELVNPKIREHQGRVVKNTGDGLLAEFGSVVDALRCATEVQAGMAERNTTVPDDRRIEFRIGIHQGDIVIEEHNIFGDAVNVAARLEGLAQPGGICVSARVRGDAAGKLDLSFEDMGQQQLKNIVRPLRVYRVRGDLLGEAMVTAQPRLTLPEKPSIAVLPFQNMSADPEQEYFADGMVEEIITALSRIRWLFIIARNSSFTYKGKPVEVKQVGRELGVRYVLEGSVRKAGQKVRITGQLIDAVTGAHLWADRFDGSLQDVFELQDQVAVSVAGIVEPTLQVAETCRSAERPTSDLTAYDLYLRALSLTHTWEKGDIIAALDLLRRAVEHDPHYGPALGLAAFCHFNLHVNGWTNDPELSRRSGVDLCRQVLRVTSDDPRALRWTAQTVAYFGEDIGAAIELIDRALALNPSFADGYVTSGTLRLWVGQPELAIDHFETSMRLSPHTRRTCTVLIGMGHFFAQRFEEAAALLLRSLQERPGWAPTYRFLAACYAHMGRLDEAEETIKRLRAISSIVVPDATHWRSPEHRELFLSGLRLAAGGET
jgi:TolB-like protein/class 3 adenylate cyclase